MISVSLLFKVFVALS